MEEEPSPQTQIWAILKARNKTGRLNLKELGAGVDSRLLGPRSIPAQNEGNVDERGEVGKELQDEKLDSELALLL